MIKKLTKKGKKTTMTARREVRLKAQKKYDEAHRKDYTNFHLKCNVTTDADVIERLQSTKNVNGYIKELVRKDIASGN